MSLGNSDTREWTECRSPTGGLPLELLLNKSELQLCTFSRDLASLWESIGEESNFGYRINPEDDSDLAVRLGRGGEVVRCHQFLVAARSITMQGLFNPFEPHLNPI